MHKTGGPDLSAIWLCKYRERIGGLKMIVGYARVNTDGQTLDAQQAALREAGAEQIFPRRLAAL